MKTNVNIKRSYKINDKEYRSLDEMPPDIRALFEKAAKTGGTIQATKAKTASTIVFNGIEYESPDAMPTYIRNLYENVMQAAEADQQNLPPEKPGYRSSRPAPSTESSLSLRSLIISLLIGGLLYLAYYLYASFR